MTCRELADLLCDFVGEELGSEGCDRIREHLGCCPPCVTLVETYRVTVRLCRKLPQRPMPASLCAKLEQSLIEYRQSAGP